jgi:Flp pilus assembly protein CpaB
MEAQPASNRIGGSWASQVLSSRRGGATVAIGAALVAGVLLFVFVQQYRKSVKNTVSTLHVLEAKTFIPRGTPASVIASGSMLAPTAVASNQALAGSVSDASELVGTVATKDIYPGQQLQAADFTRAAVTLSSQLTGTGRAIQIPIDAIQGMVGYVAPGDHVDLISVNGGAVTMLAQNVLVLSSPGLITGAVAVGASGGGLVVRVTDSNALQLISAVALGKIVVALRPPVGAQQSVGVGTKVAG